MNWQWMHSLWLITRNCGRTYLLTIIKGEFLNRQSSFLWNPYRFRVTSAMRIHFNWQIIRRPIKDAKLDGGARDANSERIQLCKRSRERPARTPRLLLFYWPLGTAWRSALPLSSPNYLTFIVTCNSRAPVSTFTPFTDSWAKNV